MNCFGEQEKHNARQMNLILKKCLLIQHNQRYVKSMLFLIIEGFATSRVQSTHMFTSSSYKSAQVGSIKNLFLRLGP